MNLSINGFKRVIQDYLDSFAEMDPLFAEKYNNGSKSIDGCCKFIVSEMQKAATNGCLGVTDDDVYSLAVHYYEEDDIEVGEITNFLVVSNQEIELTEEEKAEARKIAIEKYQQMELSKLRAKANVKPVATKTTNVQPSLFD